MKFRVFDVHKALVAASAVVEAGNTVVHFADDEERRHYIMNKYIKEKTQVEEVDGVDVFEASGTRPPQHHKLR